MMGSMELLGWIGSVLLALCALPQAVQTIKTRSAGDLSWTFLLMWGVGDLLLLIYTFPFGKMSLTLNYGLNAVLVGLIVLVKLKSD